MYKSIAGTIEKKHLDSDLHSLHKSATHSSDFGMDRTAELLDGGFGLYSTVGLKGKIDPIKTQYFRISLTRSGAATFAIGLEKYTLQRNSILFGIPGQVFSIDEYNSDFLAYYMLFSEQFISDLLLEQNTKQHYPFLSYAGLQSFLLDDATAEEIEAIAFKIDAELKLRKADCSQMIRLYVYQIIMLAGRNYSTVLLSAKKSSNSHQALYNNFLKLVSQHFLSVRKVAQYAEMLTISPDHLNRAIKQCSDKTAHELIDEMLLMEAKAYLRHSTLSIAEIAYQLEFSDPSHFNRFFKKLSTCTPLDFRKQSD